MKIDETRWNPWKSTRSSLAPCSLLGFTDPTFFLVGPRLPAHRLPQAAKGRTPQINEIHEILRKSMKFDGIHENQTRELRSSLAPCSLLGFRDPTFFLVGPRLPCHSPPNLGPLKSNAHQARDLRSSLAPCSLLGFRDPTFFLVGPRLPGHRLPKPPRPLKSMKSYEIVLEPTKIIKNR